MNSNVRGILIASVHVNAATTAVPTSAGDPTEIIASLSDDVKMIEIVNSLGGPIELLMGPNTNADRICIVPGVASTVIHQQPRTCLLPKTARISMRNLAAAAISSGLLTINLWG